MRKKGSLGFGVEAGAKAGRGLFQAQGALHQFLALDGVQPLQVQALGQAGVLYGGQYIALLPGQFFAADGDDDVQRRVGQAGQQVAQGL